MEDEIDILYHYTDSSSLMGIINNNVLWSTNINFLNDTTEYTHGLELAEDILNEKKNSENLIKIDALRLSLKQILHCNIFITSLSEKGDLLSQWRSYGQGTNGVSIGFSKENLEKKVNNNSEKKLIKCIYDKDEKKRILTEIIDKALSLDFNTNAFISDNAPRAINPNFQHDMMFAAASFKDDSFDEEIEWRLITLLSHKDVSRVKFRVGKSAIIPYIEYKLGQINDYLSEIIIGPTPNKKSAERGLMLFLGQKKILVFSDSMVGTPINRKEDLAIFTFALLHTGMLNDNKKNKTPKKNKRIIHSKIPYRNW